MTATEMLAMRKILLVDDDAFIVASLQRSLKKQKSWQIEAFCDPAEALERAREQRYDLFLSDYQMPGINGIKFLTKVRALQPEAMRIMLSGQDNIGHVEVDVKEAGIYRFISKPVRADELIAAIDHALQYRQAQRRSVG